MERDYTTEEYWLSCVLQVSKIVCLATDTCDLTQPFQQLPSFKGWMSPLLALAHYALIQVSAELLFTRKADLGWVWPFLGKPAYEPCWLIASLGTLCASRAICFQVSLNGIREKYPQGIIFKGDFNVPQEKKKDSTFELQGAAREISLSKTVKMESYFQFRGERTSWSQSGINLKSGWRKMQKISKSLNLYHKIAKQTMTWGRNFFQTSFHFMYGSAGRFQHSPHTFSVHKSINSSHFILHGGEI